jgi:hypothetical protein
MVRSHDSRAEWAAVLSLGAAGIHLSVVGSHLQEWWAYGVFFLAAGVGQAALSALVLLRPRTWLLLSGVAGNLALITMYVVSRTNGPPMGPHAGRAEEAGVLDVACTAAEVGTIVALVALLPPALGRRTATALAVAGSVLWAGRWYGILL